MTKISVQELYKRTVNTRRVKVLLAERGLNVAGLAQVIGANENTIYKAVNGERPRSHLLPFIALALEVPLAEILFDSSEKSNDRRVA